MLLPFLEHPLDRRALRFPDGDLGYTELAGRAQAVASEVGRGSAPIAVWAEPSCATVVGVVGALAAGRPVVPISPKAGVAELEHIVSDARPSTVVARAERDLPPRLAGLSRVDPLRVGSTPGKDADPRDDAAALIIYTSGTTGPPKGVVLSRRAIAANLDALAETWDWTASDEVVQSLPLFHVHGLVLGVLGPLRLGGSVHHLGGFDPVAVASALDDGGTMLFAVPTMYHRLAQVAEERSEVARALGSARILVSGSAALPASVHEHLQQLTDQNVVERYGMSETLMIASTRPGESSPGTVGFALPGVEVDVRAGSVWVRSASLLTEYLNLPEATAEALSDGWFDTGDLGERNGKGELRLIGRRSTDLIKSGGYRIGAGEIENTLLEHPDVEEAAVLGIPDADLGERIIAWVVPAAGATQNARALIDHVAEQLAPYKRPREVRFVERLPRNAMGKVQKRALIR